jgi:hypothetical protein
MKYWEIIADDLSKAGWSWGRVSAVNSDGRTIWIADAHRDDGKRFVVRAEEGLTAFLELEAEIRPRQLVTKAVLASTRRSANNARTVYAVTVADTSPDRASSTLGAGSLIHDQAQYQRVSFLAPPRRSLRKTYC